MPSREAPSMTKRLNHPLRRPLRPVCLRLQELETRLVPATLVDPMTVTFKDADGHNATVSVSRPLFDAATVNQVFTFDTGSVNGDNSVPQQLQKLNFTALNPPDVNGASV